MNSDGYAAAISSYVISSQIPCTNQSLSSAPEDYQQLQLQAEVTRGSRGIFRITHTGFLSSITNHQSPIINRQSSIANHQSPITDHELLIATNQILPSFVKISIRIVPKDRTEKKTHTRITRLKEILAQI